MSPPSCWPAPVAILAVLFFSAGVRADATTITLPLEGHYHAGRYMPVRVVGEATALEADGAVPTTPPPGAAAVNGVFPWLPVKRIAVPEGGGGGFVAQLKPLADDDALVAVVGDESRRPRAAVDRLFPGRRVVSVRLDLSQSGTLLTPAVAYETLDGVVLPQSALARIDADDLAVLLAGGTTVAVRLDDPAARPGGDWPWAREGPYWVLRHDVAGPRSPVEADVYQPTYAWVRGWPAGVRRQVVLIAVLFALAALGLTLWRSRYSVLALVGLSVVATAGVGLWNARRSPVLSAGGEVVVWDGTVAQRDDWTYRTTLRPADVSVPFRGLSHPVLASRRQLAQTGLRLVCNADGRPDHFAARLEADNALAFVTRSVAPGRPEGQPVKPVVSPLYVLANQLYPGKVAGELKAGDRSEGAWGTVVLETPQTAVAAGSP